MLFRSRSAIAHDSAAGSGAQIINLLGIGTVKGYCASAVGRSRAAAVLIASECPYDPRTRQRQQFAGPVYTATLGHFTIKLLPGRPSSL